MGGTDLRERIAELVSEATAGEVGADAVLAGGSLVALGVDSLGLLRLVDAIESEYGVEIELNSSGRSVDTLDDLASLVTVAGAEQGATGQPG
ncbi:acyl carrier protein [Micromonospora coxensis]|uniref:Acyl carrier protein n=1 Tax=Micromonospora coxensis TaxID=356852 RepID=A0A1C5H128_9ACTN|nr:acyl carrier protein [Micromonospora coxensis]SCG39746.1 Acyl carrier protein [Micromonospora coxensis]